MKNTSRVDLIALLLFAIAGTIPPSAIVANHFFDLDPVAWLHITWGRTVVGYIFCILATLVCPFNFYSTILVPWLNERKTGSREGFAHISGLPVLGSFFVFCAGILMTPSVFTGIFLLFLYLLDGNGLPFIFVSLLRR